jgi:hypothetical protein
LSHDAKPTGRPAVRREFALKSRWWWCATALAGLVGCGHSEQFITSTPAVGPFNTGPDVRLTLNPEQDYWPAWTEDGAGILYSFIRPGAGPQHRCLGLLPPAGGRGLWQLCDDRGTQSDSTNSFIAYALGSDGRLLYVEAVARNGVQGTSPAETTMWLADSARPFERRSLFSFPGFAGNLPVAWLADLAWTGPGTFIALAQDFTIFAHCKDCGIDDSLFIGEAVVRGTISASSAALELVSGTTGASSYSLAQNGASIVFTRRDDPRLFQVAASGGADTVVATVSGAQQLLGVSCKESLCVVADDPVTLSSATGGGATFPNILPGPRELRSVSLTTGSVQTILVLGSDAAAPIIATPQISPVTGDVVAQVGGGFGHLQTFSTSGSDLHLFQGLVP